MAIVKLFWLEDHTNLSPLSISSRIKTSVLNSSQTVRAIGTTLSMPRAVRPFSSTLSLRLKKRSICSESGPKSFVSRILDSINAIG